MKKKPYLHHENEPMILGEPAVSYQRTAPATYRPMALPNEVPYKGENEETDAAFEAFMNADLSELGDGFRPFTWEEARQWIAKAEENIATGKVFSHEEVMREIDELIWSYED